MNCINCGNEFDESLLYKVQPENSTQRWCVVCGAKEEARSAEDDGLISSDKRIRPARYRLDSALWKKNDYDNKPARATKLDSAVGQKKVHPKAQAGQITIQMPQLSAGAMKTIQKQQTQAAVAAQTTIANEDVVAKLAAIAKLVYRVYQQEESDGTDHGSDTVEAMEGVKDLYQDATGEELDFDRI